MLTHHKKVGTMTLQMIQFAIVLIFIWMVVLSVLYVKQHTLLSKFYKSTGKHELKGGIESLLEKDEINAKAIKEIVGIIEEMRQESKSYFCKVGLVRYNPFGRIAGDQSFVVALLDVENSGLLLNFIYNREGIRVYSKRVLKSKGVQSDLSQEEVEAITQAG